MKEIWLSSTNEHKIQEITALLKPLGIQLRTPRELADFPDVEETGETFAANALLKAQALYDVVKAPVIADDSGLAVKALNGAPGIYSARYAGLHASDAENRTLLLENMQNITDRAAQFICVIAFVQDAATVKTFEGIVDGQILLASRGEHGFGYDSLFFSPELDQTFAEATEAQKAEVSHRARALKAFINSLV